MMGRAVEFFQNDLGTLSMSRLMMFIGCVISSFVVAYLTLRGGMNEGYFGLYLAYCGGVYVSGKAIDMKAKAGAAA